MSKKSHVVISPDAQAAITREYHSLQLRFVEELNQPVANPEKLFFFNFLMRVIESRAPWLGEGGQA